MYFTSFLFLMLHFLCIFWSNFHLLINLSWCVIFELSRLFLLLHLLLFWGYVSRYTYKLYFKPDFINSFVELPNCCWKSRTFGNFPRLWNPFPRVLTCNWKIGHFVLFFQFGNPFPGVPTCSWTSRIVGNLPRFGNLFPRVLTCNWKKKSFFKPIPVWEPISRSAYL